MTALDHTLLHEVRRFITGANVHSVKTWVLCYETADPDSERRVYYERLLREFVASKYRIHVARANAEQLRSDSMKLWAAGEALDREVSLHVKALGDDAE